MATNKIFYTGNISSFGLPRGIRVGVFSGDTPLRTFDFLSVPAI